MCSTHMHTRCMLVHCSPTGMEQGARLGVLGTGEQANTQTLPDEVQHWLTGCLLPNLSLMY